MSEPKPEHLASPSSPLRFGPSGRFELQPTERRLLVDGQPAALGARALDVLITLIARPDHLVSKNELLDRVWSGLVVEEANLQMQISNLRKVLGGDAIATVPGRGYRFIAPLLAGPPQGAAPPAPAAGGVAPAAVPGVRLLVTSQLPLGLAGEQVQRLEPLAVPPHGSVPAELGDGALALLVERIQSADHRFTVGAAGMTALREICEQLDGLPLALEMAAARVPLMGLQGVRDALAQRFALLTRGHRDAATRHRTLHNALDWSYRLLSDEEQRLFRALGVFAGGFTLELAVAVMTDGSEAPDSPARWAVIDGLATLADRSLVTVSADDPPRYRLLDTMRAFARQAMAETDGEFEAVRRQHARALTAWFMRYTPSDVATQLYMADIENAREAIGWARVHDLHQAALLTARAARISTFYVWRNECTQWLRALQPAMVSSAGQALPAEVQATWWTEMARTATFLGDPQARTAARRALALWQPLQQPMQALFAAVVWVRSIEQAGDELDEACAALQAQAAATPPPTARERFWLLGALTKAALVRGDDAAVLEGRLAEVTLGQELGSDDLVETAESNVVNTLNALQRHAEAAERGRVLLSRIDRRNRDENANLPWVLAGLLEALTDIGRLDEARALVPRACAVSRRFNALAPLPSMPWLAASQGRFEAAARLVGHVRQRFEARGATPDRGENGLLERAWQAAEQALGAAQVDGLLRLGRALDEDAAAALAAG